MPAWGRWLALAIALLLAGPAAAHLLPKQNATVNLIGRSAFLVVSVPVTALPGTDRDGDGLASAAEVSAARDRIAATFTAGLSLEADSGPGAQVFAWVMPPQETDPVAGTDYVVILSRYDFPGAARAVRLTYRLFGTLADETQQTIKVTRKSPAPETVEVAVFTPAQPRHGFFAGPGRQMLGFVGTGIEHIWGGFDHLLFLLTVLLGGRGWRYWLGVTSAFTLAHSLTLALAVLGIVRLPASVVEPAIAASIVLVAAGNLFWPGASGGGRILPRLALVFACGLLHGLGFAGALGAMLGQGGGLAVPLIGFNLGIELGQLGFAGAVVAGGVLLTKLGAGAVAAWGPRIASWAALVLGAALTVERVVGG